MLRPRLARADCVATVSRLMATIGCRQLRLVSGVERADVHRFYEREGMAWEAKYFSMDLDWGRCRSHPGMRPGYLALNRPSFDLQRMANGRAVTDCTILTVPYARLQALLAADPGAWQYIARLVLMDSLRFATLAVDLMTRDSDRRVAAVLLGQAGCRQAGEAAEVHLSQSDLGEMTKLSRHPVASILAGFVARGWVDCGYRSIRVLDAAALRVFANGGDR